MAGEPAVEHRRAHARDNKPGDAAAAQPEQGQGCAPSMDTRVQRRENSAVDRRSAARGAKLEPTHYNPFVLRDFCSLPEVLRARGESARRGGDAAQMKTLP